MQVVQHYLVFSFLVIIYSAPFFLSVFISCFKVSDCTYSLSKYRALIFSGASFLNIVAFTVIYKLLAGRWNFVDDWLSYFFSESFFLINLHQLFIAGIYLVCALAIGCFVRRFACRITGNRSPSAASLSELKKKSVLGLSVYCSVFLCFLLFYYHSADQVLISEIQPYEDVPYGDSVYPNYIELYNPGPFVAVVHHSYFSDDPENPEMCPIPNTVISPNSFAVIQVADTDMKIKSSGNQTIGLYSDLNELIDSVDTTEIPRNYSYSLSDLSTKKRGLYTVTPGCSVDSAISYLSPPVFSQPAGFYDEPFELFLSASDNGDYRFYYTADGSVPSTESTLYDGSIYIYDRTPEANTVNEILDSDYSVALGMDIHTENMEKAFVIRAIAVDDLGNQSPESVSTYFIGRSRCSDTAVVSLIADPEQLFGSNGIYVSGDEYTSWLLSLYDQYLYEVDGYTFLDIPDDDPSAPVPNYKLETEIPATLEVFSDDSVFFQSVGLRIAGGATRSNRVKPLNIYARKQYSGSNVFATEVFEGLQSHKIGVRGGYANTLCQSLVRDRSAATQGTIKIALFLNGEYICTSNLIEKYDERYFAEHYNVPKDDVIIVKWGEPAEYLSPLYDFLSNHDMSDPDSYSAFCDMVDIQSYIDYLCTRIYIGDLDFTETRNTTMWKTANVSTGYADGKWRWALADLDGMEWRGAEGYGFRSSAEVNTFLFGRNAHDDEPYSVAGDTIFCTLRENSSFNKQFVTTFLDLSNENFRYENVRQTIDAYGDIDETYQISNSLFQPIEVYQSFFQNRAQYIIPYMADLFQLTGTLENITLCVNQPSYGTVTLNTLTPTLQDGCWCGKYYTDYSITLTATPKPGYRFIGWQGDIESDELQIEFYPQEGGVSVYAIFEEK